MFKFNSIEELIDENRRWDITFCGKAIDDRGNISYNYAESNSSSLVAMAYNADDMRLDVNGDTVECYGLSDYINQVSFDSVLIDATTLGVPELALLLRVLSTLKKKKISIIYTEPKDYRKKESQVFGGRVFNLTDKFKGFSGIPTISKRLDLEEPNDVVFFLGFEGHRLQTALEELNIASSDCSLFFGVPPYKPGWEIDAFENNIKYVNDNDLDGRVYFCGADNPAAVFYELDQLRRSMQDESQLTVAPIGSKPHSLGALLFTAVFKDTNLLYDHPIKSHGRSQSVGAVHIYDVVF
ncbi:hypothetical protein GCM10011352_10420 [Marinobacterium zhoushanense]|uniref:Uncharacterized protein n=1 Tax=Marinobacterium zhoushanense TaxID=1679163 RepID=A0ABQ1K3V9_9GAMM|nr:hypothetical protein [Marinobacterium zhoushanense]GGB86430.1 hypothetical protein GCM10011352_10420 [Marinobacterium zhoushanense]